MKPAELFGSAYSAACDAIASVHGRNWRVGNLDGVTWGRLAHRLCRYTTDRGTKIIAPQHRAIPPAEFWPGGKIPRAVALDSGAPSDRDGEGFRRMAEIARDMDEQSVRYWTKREAEHQARLEGARDIARWEKDAAGLAAQVATSRRHLAQSTAHLESFTKGVDCPTD